MYKTIIILLIIISMFTILSSAEFDTYSVATTDGFLSTIINPAALGFGNAGGIGYVQHYYDNHFRKNYYDFILNFDNLGYNYSKRPNDYLHRIALGTRLDETNFYLGSDYEWNHNRHAFNSSVLYRPWDFLSLGANWKNTFKSNDSIVLGLAIRPLGYISDFWTGLTLSYDKVYANDNWDDGILTLHLEPLEGFSFLFSNNFNTEEYSAGLSLNLSHFNFGATYSKDEINRGISYANISHKTFKNVLTKEKQNKFYNYKLKGNIVDQNPRTKFGPFTVITAKDKTLSSVLKTIKELKKEEKVKGLVFKSGNIITNRASYKELQKALLDFKDCGKKIVYYFENTSNMNYTLAAAVADKIYLNPGGSLGLNGISITIPYLKDLLDTLGVEVVNFRSHDFKTAGNILSETSMTEAEREMYDRMLSDLYEEMVSAISIGRKIEQQKVEIIIDDGPYFIAQKCLDNGLVDGLIYEDEIDDKLEEDFGEVEVIDKYKTDYVRKDWSDQRRDKIAIIYAVGSIHSGEGVPGKSIGSKTLTKYIKDAREDDSVKGIILRVNSGGGSSLASDIIAHEVEKCTKGENAKPIIASMSGAAASGGYYISCPADKIIAQPETITGSIGVIAILPNLSELYDKIHINWDTVKKGENADIFSMSRKMTTAEKEKIEKSVKNTYCEFVDIVAQNRDMSREQVHKVAKGRVWTGKSAKELGLIDDLGGLEYAIELMKSMCNIRDEDDIFVTEYPLKEESFMTINLSTENLFSPLKIKLPRHLTKLEDMTEDWKKYDSEHILYLYPFEFWKNIE